MQPLIFIQIPQHHITVRCPSNNKLRALAKRAAPPLRVLVLRAALAELVQAPVE